MSDSIIIIDSAALAAPIQQLVDRTLAADRKGGEALWEKCCAVADAKAQTKRGEWESYLSACGMHERAARRLLGIAYRGRQSEEFREKVISGWLPFAVAAIVAHADEAELHRVLSQDEAPTRKQLTAAPAEKPDTGVRNAAPLWVCPECRRELTPPKKNPDPGTICTTCAINREATRNAEAAQREYALTARRNRLISRATKLGYAIAFRSDGIRFTKNGIPFGGCKDLDELEELIVDWERTPAPPAPAADQGNGLVCAHCGWKSPPALHTKLCDSCYSLNEAQKWESGSEDMRWRLKHAADFTKRMPEELRVGRIAEIRDIAAAHDIDLDAPIIISPMAVEPDLEIEDAPPRVAMPPAATEARYQRAETLLASVIESIPDDVIRLVALLTVEDYDPQLGSDPREELWLYWQGVAHDNPDLLAMVLD